MPNSKANWMISSGEIFSSSRWFSNPPDQVNILGRSLLDIKYFIDHPFSLDILFQQSYILSLKFWMEKTVGFWAKGSIGYKPVNELSIVIGKEEFFKTFEEEGKKSQIQQRLTYLPAKQGALSAEIGWDHKRFSSVLSFGGSKTLKKRAPAIYKRKFIFLRAGNDFTYISAFLKGALSKKHYIQISYLRSWLQKREEKDSPGLDWRKIRHGLGFEWHWEFSSPRGLKRDLSVKYRYSIPEKGGILSAQALFHPLPKLYIALTADILGAKDSSGKSFLSYFRANDYFGLKAGYVF